MTVDVSDHVRIMLSMESLAEPFAKLKADLATRRSTLVDVPAAPAQAWMSHAQFEAEDPGAAAHAQQLEASRMVAYAAKHGSAEGFRALREFPCRGTLRVEDPGQRMWMVACDACGYATSVRGVKRSSADSLLSALDRAGVDPKYAGVEFESRVPQQKIAAACSRWAHAFAERPLPAPALIGAPGTGKTHLLASIAEWLIVEHKVPVVYRTAVALFDEIRAGFDRKTYEDQWQAMLDAPVLLLDDLGDGKPSDWRMERTERLVDYRYGRNLPIVIASNVPPDAWERMFGWRTASRLGEMTRVLEFTGPDYRELARQAAAGMAF